MVNYHIHSHYCHGVGEFKDYIDNAISNNLKSIGFTSHAPLPFEKKWVMNHNDLISYCDEIKQLKKIYKNRIDIFLGLEIDYLPNIKRFDNFRTLGFDYIIGSNHFIGEDINGHLKRIESSNTPLIIEKQHKAYIENYFQQISNMTITEKPDIIAHFDLVKKINLHQLYFNENEPWYQKIVNETLDVISKSNVIVEINTSDLKKAGMNWTYPSLDIIQKCYLKGIPITIGSDAHKPDDIASGYDLVFNILRGVGFNEIIRLTSNGWIKDKLG